MLFLCSLHCKEHKKSISVLGTKEHKQEQNFACQQQQRPEQSITAITGHNAMRYARRSTYTSLPILPLYHFNIYDYAVLQVNEVFA